MIHYPVPALRRLRCVFAVAALLLAPPSVGEGMRVAGNFSANGKHVAVEKAFFIALPKISL